MEEPPNGWTTALNETAKAQRGADHGGLYGAPALGSIVIISKEMLEKPMNYVSSLMVSQRPSLATRQYGREQNSGIL